MYSDATDHSFYHVSTLQVLNQVTPKPDQIERAVAFMHPHKNRSMDYVPCEPPNLILPVSMDCLGTLPCR